MQPSQVLLVEDEPTLQSLLTTTLQHAYPAAHVHALSDGLAALAAYQQHGADLLLTGSGMPGLSGAQLIQALRAAGATMPIVAFSGDPSQQVALLAAGATTFLAEPFPMTTLVAVIAAL